MTRSQEKKASKRPMRRFSFAIALGADTATVTADLPTRRAAERFAKDLAQGYAALTYHVIPVSVKVQELS